MRSLTRLAKCSLSLSTTPDVDKQWQGCLELPAKFNAFSSPVVIRIFAIVQSNRPSPDQTFFLRTPCGPVENRVWTRSLGENYKTYWHVVPPIRLLREVNYVCTLSRWIASFQIFGRQD